MTLAEQILSQMPDDVLGRLRGVDRLWQGLRETTPPIPKAIKESSNSLETLDWDVAICGGTLGILLGTALQQRGCNVILLERGTLRGRDQEWNISREELGVLLELELLSKEELERAIATEYNPARVTFHQGCEIWVNDVLNIGVDPVFLLETLKQKFLAAGGDLLEKTPFKSAIVYPDGVLISAGEQSFTTRLLVDGMGHFSPIAQQARKGEKPEGVCLVVGSCARGYEENETGDLIASFTPIQNQCQYFWEAFPARDGRTTYLFTYVDPHPDRVSLEFLMDEYLRLLPEYQNVARSRLDFQRFLFGFFPAYRKTPLRVPWDRVLPIGDSSGAQSPVSFGGFGSMVRHLKRLTLGIEEALQSDCLTKEALDLLQPYQPNISVSWLFQRTMSVPVDRAVSPNRINELMSGVFEVMDRLGDDVLKPFLQDVIQFPALTKTLPRVNPQLVLPFLPQIGVPMLADWLGHYLNLGLYSTLSSVGDRADKLGLHQYAQKLSPQKQYYYHRWLDAWKYGSGGDF
ncbi:FAD-binding oxidoreductase [Lusitaniella coriacea LEGE 07157]|uniref:FAD-binding oxidoreductase n=1 Tax=Lusitaniella coriacea LEGE 07157 TaxID=945747 RepID=A0A8J7DZC7_9CYAN|nr:FAD-binding oxidoreductase [Lusitaniella coriacea]MBE9118386.1 FAD-binding oxidoreductase [Lusitaniella coriacea LEGE 07157]